MKKSREKVLKVARSWLGKTEYDGSHKEIIDVYNEGRPARAYKMKYNDHWCATFVSAVAIKAGVTDVLPIECGCERMINLFIKKGEWVEDDSYKPAAGDVIFYDWDDSGLGDNTGWSDHVGIVEKVEGTMMTIIEGNISDKVGRRHIKVNSKYIRGYGVPKYDDTKTAPASKKQDESSAEIKVGDEVFFTGNTHYTNSYKEGLPYMCRGGKAKVTKINPSGVHPYHLIHSDGSSTVYGWVDEKDVVK